MTDDFPFDWTTGDAVASDGTTPEVVLTPTVETDPIAAGQWAVSVTEEFGVRYCVVQSITGDDALVKTRDDDDEFITVPVASLTRSEAGHR